MKALIIGFIILFLISPLFRTIINNLHLIGIYSFVDIYQYIKLRRWLDFNLYGIDMFVGMFGHGKTLSMAHRARMLYKKFGDRIRFISNFKLVNIPYTYLYNFNQLVDLGEEEDSKFEGTVVLIDEIENILNNRNFSNFPLALLHTLTQQRKKHVYIMCSAQRFFMVDKLFRSITTNVFKCDKYWRLQHVQVFDAWDVENSMNYKDIRRISNKWWFVKNQDYNSYDTSEMIKKSAAEEFISNEEALNRLGEANRDMGAVSKTSKSYRRSQRKK